MATPQSAGTREAPGFRARIDDALRYWEPRRILYNAVLGSVCLAWLLLTWPHFRPAFALGSLAALFVLALAANVCYCAAYVVDIALQYSSYRARWLRWRWALWLSGMLFAVLVADYWIADEIYPGVPPS